MPHPLHHSPFMMCAFNFGLAIPVPFHLCFQNRQQSVDPRFPALFHP
jgi:hypothetical protein